MATLNMAALSAELLTDPIPRGYAGMTNQQAADSINLNIDRPIDVETVEGWLLWGATVQTEYLLVSALAAGAWDALCSQSSISVKDAGVRARTLAIWGGGTTTRANLIALQTKLITRGEELGLPFIGAHHVAEARA